MRKGIYKETLDILEPFATAHPGYTYWVCDWVHCAGIDPQRFGSSQKAWAAMMDMLEDVETMSSDPKDSQHRVFISAAPKGSSYMKSKTVVAVWEDWTVHKEDGLMQIKLS